jgi:hypothetical protein
VEIKYHYRSLINSHYLGTGTTLLILKFNTGYTHSSAKVPSISYLKIYGRFILTLSPALLLGVSNGCYQRNFPIKIM